MLANVAGVLLTFKLWQTKNPTPYPWYPGKSLILPPPLLLQVLGFVELG